jgi:putative Holliday junction resolvase
LICLGVDPGLSRVGIALGQDSLAIALETAPVEICLDRISDLAREKHAVRIYFGLPLSLAGTETESTRNAVKLAQRLAGAVSIPIFLVDERLTSSMSSKLAINAGKSTRESKQFVDAEAARLIIESAIASNHRLGVRLEEYLAR